MFTYICTLYICKCSTLDKFYFGQCATLGGFYFGAGTGSGSTTSSSPVRNWPGGSLRARVRVWERGRAVGDFFGPEMFLKMLEGSLEMFSLLVFQLQCNTSDFEWKLNFTVSLTMI